MLNKKLCVLPWLHIATQTDGAALLCCVSPPVTDLNLNDKSLEEIKNSDYFKQARLAMLNNEEFRGCNVCYKEEKLGIISHRQNENMVWENFLTQEVIDDIISKTEPDGTINNDLYTVDLRLGNICNLSCVMCRPQDSTKWIRESKKLSKELITDAKWDWKYKSNIDLKKFEWYKKPEFLESFYENCKNMKLIIFAGGEPLLIKEHKDIIKEIVKRGYAKNIQLNYHTNATIYDPELMELWKSFNRIELFLSIDGIRGITDYIRYPSNFDEIEKNLRLYDDNASENMYFKVLYTVQALNIFYLPEFCEWLDTQNYKKIIVRWPDNTIFHTGVLWGPPYLSCTILPKHTKEIITKKITDYFEKNKDRLNIWNLIEMINLMNSSDDSHLLAQFKEYMSKMDSYRNLYYNETFKELIKIL